MSFSGVSMGVTDAERALPVSGVVIARNEADRIERCVRSLTGLCAEVVVLDSGSTDDTVARACAIGADRKSVVSGKSVSGRVDLGGRRIIKKKKNQKIYINIT